MMELNHDVVWMTCEGRCGISNQLSPPMSMIKMLNWYSAACEESQTTNTATRGNGPLAVAYLFQITLSAQNLLNISKCRAIAKFWMKKEAKNSNIWDNIDCSWSQDRPWHSVYYTPLPESMRPIIGTNNQINKLLIRPGRGWRFVPVFHVSRCRAAPCSCAPSGSVPLWPHSTLVPQID